MRIIIVGVGKVGRLLVDFLSQEKHQIIVVDKNENLVQEVVDFYDVKGVVGNGASYEVLLDAEANKSDLLIACTESDELNILSCLVSRKCGTKQTIARVRNPEYSKQINFIHDELDVNLIVNPEYEAATEISKILRFPSALKIETFAKGRVDMVEVHIDENSILVGKSLKEIREQFQIKFLVCAVERNGKAYIPDGHFVIQAKDKIHVTGSIKDINLFFNRLGILKNKAKNVMLIGGGRISFYLAKQLLESGVKVKIIEVDFNRCLELSKLLPGATVIHGTGSDQDLLIEEGIENIDALVTLTGIDEENIIISLFAEIKKVPKIITKINRYTYSGILKSINLDSIISPKAITANHIIRYTRSLMNAIGSEVVTLYKLVDNQVEAAEFYLERESRLMRIPFKDLNLKENILIACIIRNNNVIIPTGNDYIIEKDSIVVVSTNHLIRDIDDILE